MMNMPFVTMDPAVAREKRRRLRKQLHRRAEAEYAALERVYGALEDGQPVISLADAITAGGLADERGRPKLAIARADRRQVRVRRHWNGLCEFWCGALDSFGGAVVHPRAIGMEQRVWTQLPPGAKQLGYGQDGYAMVPLVPAEVVSKIGGTTNLRRFHTLFEVEGWADRPVAVRPDRDPYLLHDLGDGLFSVVAQWDLTEAERLVMGVFRRG